jgi:uncharacterized protein
MNLDSYKIVKEFIDDTKKILKKNIIKKYLFGSYAKNQQNEWSDIDVLIIVKQLDNKIRKEISSLSSDYSINKDILISPILKDIDVWEKNKAHNTLFYKEIEKYGIEL